MEWGMTRMPAFVHERLWRLLGHADLNDLLSARVRLAEVAAETALAIVDVLHWRSGEMVRWYASQRTGIHAGACPVPRPAV